MAIAAIIPAYNEERTIGSIVHTVRQVPLIKEVLVVCDGCIDNTAGVARQAGATVIQLPENMGKGGAMMVGAQSTTAEVVLFLDADLVGLKVKHIVDLIEPVVLDGAKMSVGLFGRGRLATDLAQVIAPYLSGQRAMVRDLLFEIDSLEVTRFGVEVALTNLVRKKNHPVVDVILKDMTHIMKEEKLGLVKGFGARMKMYWEIAKCLARG
ncbi:MAG: glycosyltransferase family 2 protein [Clostridia bacterium]|nr:glycosyltransferase family 2 protein [Clostridia bacterium]